jgi:chitin disaccharide deacetylase
MDSPRLRSEVSAAPVRGRVVFHADDLGMNSSIDSGILDSFANGVLTSTAVLANGPSAEVALKQVLDCSTKWCDGSLGNSRRRLLLNDRREPFDIGVHLNLTQGRPLTGSRYPSELLDDQGRFPGACRLFAALLASPRKWKSRLGAELAAQISWVTERGIQPAHVNGHQYIELYPCVSEIIVELLARFSITVVRLPVERRLWATTLLGRGVPVWMLAHIKRAFATRFAQRVRAAKLRHADGFFGTAHAGKFTKTALSRRFLPAVVEPLIEIGVHPGGASLTLAADPLADGWLDPLASQRPSERDAICSDGLVGLLMDQQLGLGRLRHSGPCPD